MYELELMVQNYSTTIPPPIERGYGPYNIPLLVQPLPLNRSTRNSENLEMPRVLVRNSLVCTLQTAILQTNL